jgi:hypothetical protein
MSEAVVAARGSEGAAAQERAAPGDRAVRARRIDWRLVLPDPTPGRVAWFGPHDEATSEAFAEAGWELVAGGTGAAGAGPGVDLAVVERATPGHLDAAVQALGPGASVYVRIAPPWQRARPGTRSLAPDSVARRLAAAGLTGVRRHAHVPHDAARSAIVPLDEPEALRLFLVHRGGRVGGRAARLMAERLRSNGWLGRVVPSVSIVASRPMGAGGATQPAARRDAVAAYLDGLGGGDHPAPAARPSPLLLTPSFRASRHVVALRPDASGTRIDVVAKIARVADSGSVTEREAAVLHALQAMPASVRDTAPTVLAVDRPWGLPTLVERGVVGTALDPSTVRRDPDAAVDLVLPWLAALRRDVEGAVPGAAGAERLERLLLRPLAAFSASFEPGAHERQRMERTRAIAGDLAGAVLPLVVEHGDVSHPNLLVADGRLAAVDWELGEPLGLPGHDLANFLGYVAVARARAASPAAQTAALRSVLHERPDWAEAAERRYAEAIGLDPELLPALTVVSWARRLVGLVERLYDGTPAVIPAATVEWLRAHRFDAAWSAALEHHDRRRSR